MEIKFTFLVLMQKVLLHELRLSPQPVLDVLERGWNLRQVFKEFWDVTVIVMAPDSSELLSLVALKDRSRKPVPNTDPVAPAAGHRQPRTQPGAS